MKHSALTQLAAIATICSALGSGAYLFFDSGKGRDKSNLPNLNQTYPNGDYRKNMAVGVGSGLIRGATAELRKGDYIAFSLNYNLNEGVPVRGLRARMRDLRGNLLSEGSKLQVWGSLSAENYADSTGTITISVQETVNLQLRHISWQRQDCKGYSCETTIPGSAVDIFTAEGLSLGDVPNTEDYYKGGIVVQYVAH